jgi:hypothetical protein
MIFYVKRISIEKDYLEKMVFIRYARVIQIERTLLKHYSNEFF